MATTTTKMHSKKAVHFGSGAIGRGFVGQFLHNSGYELVFIDVADAVIAQLNQADSYTVIEVGGDNGQHESLVSNFRAINSKTDPDQVVAEIATADTVTCAVGPNILRFIAPLIAKGINARDHTSLNPVAVVACENAINATTTLASFITPDLSAETNAVIGQKVRFANSAVDRIVPQQAGGPATATPAGTNPLDVRIESFYEWCIESPPFDGAVQPPIQGVHYVRDLAPYIERKLYTVNTAHATAAYFGYHNHKPLVHQAMADPTIRSAVRAAIAETSVLITTKYGIPPKEQAEYAEKIVTRISNEALEDQVERVGRDPLRKLSRNERLVGPASQLAEMGLSYTHLLAAIDMAFRFLEVPDDAASAQLAVYLNTLSAKQVVEKVCGLESTHKLFPDLVRVVSSVQVNTSRSSKKHDSLNASGDTFSAHHRILAEM